MSGNDDKRRKFDLEERTAIFGEAVLEFGKKIPINDITRPLIRQFIRSGTSIGANYCEADCAESRRDFEHKLGISKKEAKETKFWLRMVAKAVPSLREESRVHWKEADELQRILITIIKKSKENSNRA